MQEQGPHYHAPCLPHAERQSHLNSSFMYTKTLRGHIVNGVLESFSFSVQLPELFERKNFFCANKKGENVASSTNPQREKMLADQSALCGFRLSLRWLEMRWPLDSALIRESSPANTAAAMVRASRPEWLSAPEGVVPRTPSSSNMEA